MRASNKQLTILSEAEKAALYESPDFDDEQRLSFLNLTPAEQALVRNRANLSAQVHCALQIGYFKSMHMFFPIHWDEVQEDTDFIMQEYFPEHMFFYPTTITKHQYYAQCHAIAAHFGYQLWSKEFEPLLREKAEKIIYRDVSPQFIVMELLAFMREKKIMRPGYTTLQASVSNALNAERKRLGTIVHESLTEADKSGLQKLLFEKETETLSGLADLKQDAKDFKPRMISAERDKMIAIKPLYLLAKSLLPKLKLSQQNLQYYASLVDYYTVYDLRKKLKSDQTYLYLVCYIHERYLKLDDNLMDAFCFQLKECELEIKEKAQDAYSEYAVNRQSELSVMQKLAELFIKKELSDEVSFGKVRQEAFTTIIPEDELRDKISNNNAAELKLDFSHFSLIRSP